MCDVVQAIIRGRKFWGVAGKYAKWYLQASIFWFSKHIFVVIWAAVLLERSTFPAKVGRLQLDISWYIINLFISWKESLLNLAPRSIRMVFWETVLHKHFVQQEFAVSRAVCFLTAISSAKKITHSWQNMLMAPEVGGQETHIVNALSYEWSSQKRNVL